MNNIAVWILFGVFVSIIMSTFDLPLRVNKLLFTMVIGVIGSLIGGMFAYFIYGISVHGINVSSLIIVFTGAMLSVLLLKVMERNTRGTDEF